MSINEQFHVFPTISRPVIPTLRPYQHQLISEIYQEIRAGNKRIVAFAPTGSGKTVISAQIAQHAVSKDKYVLFIVHRDILVHQTALKLLAFGINPGFIKSGWPEDRNAFVQIASVQTMAKRNWWQNFSANVVILDEVHLLAYTKIVQQMMFTIHPQAVYLGFTATPWRTKKCESLGDFFQALVSAPLPKDLIDAGFLVKPSYFSLSIADLKSVGTTVSGNFDEAQLALACDRPELIAQTVLDWHKLARLRRTIAFAVNVAHARHLASAFTASGVSATFIDGSVPPKCANQIYHQLATAEIQVLCSCMKLVEGFDVPAVEAVLLCRPTHSRSLHFQMLGRGLRQSPETGKTDCIIIDQVGNVQRHGFVEDVREVSLAPSQSPESEEGPKKICPPEHGGCAAIIYGFQMRCTQCGYIFPRPKKVYLVPQLEQLLSQEDIERYEFYRQILKQAYEKNFDPGSSAHTFRSKFGHWPPNAWARGAVFGYQPNQLQRNSYHIYLSALAQRKQKPQSWIDRYMSFEFGFALD